MAAGGQGFEGNFVLEISLRSSDSECCFDVVMFPVFAFNGTRGFVAAHRANNNKDRHARCQ
eukprot:2258744-Pyramimonas_sp.AAC.1